MTPGAPLSRILSYRKPLVCIARFTDKYGSVNGIPREAPHVFYQIIVDPENVSKSGQFIEFMGRWQQICGWKPVDSIEVHEILGESITDLVGEGGCALCPSPAGEPHKEDCANRKLKVRPFCEPSNVETLHDANMADAAFHEQSAA